MNTAMQTPSTQAGAVPAAAVPDVEAVLARAASYVNVGLIPAAAEIYEAILKVEGYEDLPAARHGLARCSFARGELHETLGHLQMLMQQDATNAEVNNDVGVVFYRLGLLERAKEQLERAVMLDPNDMTTRRNLIEVSYGCDDLEGCLRHCEVEQAREPTVEISEIAEMVRAELAQPKTE